MATPINTILNWFKTGLKPTQAQFWSSWQSFWHKDETIPQNKIENLQQSFDNKLDTEASTYVNISGFEVIRAGKTNLNDFELNDRFRGWIGDRLVEGKITALPVSLPDDINDETKVKLAIDTSI